MVERPVAVEEDIEDDIAVSDVEIDRIDVTTQERQNGLLVVPLEFRTQVLQHHDSQIAGHWGKETDSRIDITQFYYFLYGMVWRKDIARYVAGCIRFQKSKADCHSKQTQLRPMPTETQPWEEVAMDFVGELPKSEGYNAILVVTDHLQKHNVICIPAKTTWAAEDVANAHINDI